MPPDGVTSYSTPCGSDASEGSPPNGPTFVSDHRWWLADAVAPGDVIARTVPSTARPDSNAVRTGTRDIGRLPPQRSYVCRGFGVEPPIPLAACGRIFTPSHRRNRSCPGCAVAFVRQCHSCRIDGDDIETDVEAIATPVAPCTRARRRSPVHTGVLGPCRCAPPM